MSIKDSKACELCKLHSGDKTPLCRINLKEQFGTEMMSGHACLPKDKAIIIMLGELLMSEQIRNI